MIGRNELLDVLWPCKDANHPFYKNVAYFSMEFAIDQSLKTYSGGLGFLAGSHMRSAYELRQNMIGIGILWKYGYYTQNQNGDGTLRVDYIAHHYSFLEKVDVQFSVLVHGKEVQIETWLLKPSTFGTAPIFLLSTHQDSNDFLSQTITHRLYDATEATKIAQSMVLGIGGAKLIEALGLPVEVYHLNEGHGLPLAYYLYAKLRNVQEVQKRIVFTTHTPEMAGNESHNLQLLEQMSFFNGLTLQEVKEISGVLEKEDKLNYTVSALHLSKKANGVSQMHSQLANQMWQPSGIRNQIIPITNAQNKKYWVDKDLEDAFVTRDDEKIVSRKKQLKRALFDIVADQCGKLFDPNILTVVWARRFAGYKRADFLLKDLERFNRLISNPKYPVQVIWAGKPYPEDYEGIGTFNRIANTVRNLPNCAILFGYELSLSASLKRGADVWLNNPRITREASGTSGMTAAMNGTINLSIPDGWVPEFAKPDINGFYLSPSDKSWSIEKQDEEDHQKLMAMLEEKVVKEYYESPDEWVSIMKQAWLEIAPTFDADRMAIEYYEKIYNA